MLVMQGMVDKLCVLHCVIIVFFLVLLLFDILFSCKIKKREKKERKKRQRDRGCVCEWKKKTAERKFTVRNCC